MFMQL